MLPRKLNAKAKMLHGKDHFILEDDHYICLMHVLPLTNHILKRERSGSVVESLTRDREAAGSSLTGITVLCP